MKSIYWLAAGAAIVASAGAAQDAASPADERVVEGATPERAQLIAQCAGHKFETYVHVDAAGQRAKRVRLCANPGASDAEWVQTLKSAIAQIELQPFPAAAKAQLESELRAEIAKFERGAVAAAMPEAKVPATPQAPSGGLQLDPRDVRGIERPADRFEVSTLPSLDRPVTSATASIPSGGTVASGALSSTPAPAPLTTMRARVTCLAPGERGKGMTCDYLRGNTVMLLRAQSGMEKGARLRFLRRGEERGEILLSGLADGQATRIKLPAEVCRGVSSTKVELQLLPTDSRGRVAGTVGSFGVRC